MPTFEVDVRGRRSARRLTQRAPERRIQDLLLHNPTLLGHLNELKPREIVWFWHRSNGAGDLWGIDDRGHLVIVELKKRLGSSDERRAASQIRAAARYARKWKLQDLEEKYRWMKAKYALRGGAGFLDELQRRTGRAVHLKLSKPYLYVVAGHYTSKGVQAVHRKSRRRSQEVRLVMMYEIQLPKRATTSVIVTTERLKAHTE
jgi:hypothetical protein